MDKSNEFLHRLEELLHEINLERSNWHKALSKCEARISTFSQLQNMDSKINELIDEKVSIKKELYRLDTFTYLNEMLPKYKNRLSEN